MNFGHVPLVTVLSAVTVTLVPLQASKAVGGVKVQGESHGKPTGEGQLIVGGVLSITATLWLHVLVFPHGSVTTQVRVITLGQIPLVTVPSTAIVRLVPQQ